MNERFFELKKEKQDRMINSALKFFAKGGYRYASTDDMVKDAGISKGLLFHYFGTKLELYTFVYEYSARYIALELSTVVSAREKDLFEIMKQMQRAYMNAMRGYPYMIKFLNRARTEDIIEAYMATEEMRKTLVEAQEAVYSRADVSLLPSGVDAEKLKRMLEYTFTGLMDEKFNDASFQPDMLYEETEGYLNMLKAVFAIR